MTRFVAQAVVFVGLCSACDPARKADAVGPSDAPTAVSAEPPPAVVPTEAPAPAEPPLPDLPAQASALVETMELLAKLHTEHAGDCDGLASGIRGFATEHRKTLDGQTAELHAWIEGDDATSSRLVTAMETVMTGGMRCSENANVQAVYAEMRDAPSGG